MRWYKQIFYVSAYINLKTFHEIHVAVLIFMLNERAKINYMELWPTTMVYVCAIWIVVAYALNIRLMNRERYLNLYNLIAYPYLCNINCAHILNFIPKIWMISCFCLRFSSWKSMVITRRALLETCSHNELYTIQIYCLFIDEMELSKSDTFCYSLYGIWNSFLYPFVFLIHLIHRHKHNLCID